MNKAALLDFFVKDYYNFVKNPDNLIKVNKIKKLLSNIEDIKTGLTEYEIIKETPLYRLLHYKPIKEQIYKPPVLIVYALINKSYIFDLQENKSWVKNLLEHGMNVYLLDWKAPSKLDKFTTVDDYVNIFIYECVEQIKHIENVKRISLQGYCMGGTMSLMYTSLYQKNVRNLVTIAPIVDTDKDKSVIKNMAKYMDIDRVLSYHDNFPYELLYLVYASLKPFKQGVNKYMNLFNNLDDENFVQNFLRIEKWLYDTPPIAGDAFRQWIKDIYQQNLFAKNKMIVGENKINLANINVPTLNVVAEADHLVSPECSISLNELISSEDKSLMTFPTGHVGLVASSYSQKMVLPKISKWIQMH
ncbi:MAG TPA: class III poly(R)-hydroxyalkanoic acid synthase subunit PhaC [Verrucomicrobiae bacterium]|nr:class III poly(R)-hydroxyalkanoic acid synthase subunit PhaC [Verrucomicrobiae bacterium]